MANTSFWGPKSSLRLSLTIGSLGRYSGGNRINALRLSQQRRTRVFVFQEARLRLYFPLSATAPAEVSYNVCSDRRSTAEYFYRRVVMGAEELLNRQEARKRDARCIERIRSGDSQAFAELVRVYYPIYFHLVMGITANPDQAEDLVQEGFIAIFANLDSLKQPERFGSWGYTLVKRIASRFHWRLKMEKNLSASKDPVLVAWLEQCFSGGKPQVSLEQEELYQTLWEAIRKLSPKCREVIILYFFQGYTLEDISGILNISVFAAEKRLARARVLLRKIMEGSR